MEDRLTRLESEVQRLSRAVERLEKSLDALETTATSLQAQRTGASLSAPAEGIASSVPASDILSGITLFGRTLLVLGGGYLLRAMTESGTLAPLTGVALGLLYALFWMVMADRAGATGNKLSAAFHGAAAVLVAFPLLWETTARFQLLSPGASAACLTLVSLAAVTVSWRWRLRVFAWVTVLGATATSFALIVGTRQLAPFTLFLVGVSLATYWLSEHAEWPIVHWVVAGLADTAVALVILGALIEQSSMTRTSAITIPAVLLVLFLLSFALRLLWRKLPPGRFEILQTGAVIALGYGGSLLVAGRAPAGVFLGVCGIVVGLLCYRQAFASSGISSPGRLYLEGTGAGLLCLGSFGVLANPTLLLASAGVALTWIGRRFARSVLSLQGAFFVLAAAVTSGVIGQGAYAFIAPAGYSWPSIDASWMAGLAAAAAAYALPQSGLDRVWWERWRTPKLLLLGILVWGLGGAILAGIVPVIAGTPGVDASAAILATVRTAVLALSSLVLAVLARIERFREAAWLVYPVLLAGGIKLVVEDFIRGRAATLFVGLALYGGAVFIAPRLTRDRSDPVEPT